MIATMSGCKDKSLEELSGVDELSIEEKYRKSDQIYVTDSKRILRAAIERLISLGYAKTIIGVLRRALKEALLKYE